MNIELKTNRQPGTMSESLLQTFEGAIDDYRLTQEASNSTLIKYSNNEVM